MLEQNGRHRFLMGENNILEGTWATGVCDAVLSWILAVLLTALQAVKVAHASSCSG